MGQSTRWGSHPRSPVEGEQLSLSSCLVGGCCTGMGVPSISIPLVWP